jgi:pimeloyl-ACP methyl ester carboxylesterase
VELFDRLTDAFERAMALRSPAGERLSIAYGSHELPGWFLRADDAAVGERRPVIICTNGYDATMADMYLAQAIDATRRGYHCVLFDGPGQGAMLVHEGLAMVPDWENVVRPVVDTVLGRADVDSARVVLQGWSLGGHLAARAATGEPRLAAVVLDPPGWGLMAGVPAFLRHIGLSEAAVAALPALSDGDEAMLMAAIRADRTLRWEVVARDLWVNGAADLRDFLRLAAAFTLDGRIDRIRCPVIATKAEADPLAAGADAFVARITAPTTFLRFSVAEGAGDHCELQSRWLANQRILDALDSVLGR